MADNEAGGAIWGGLRYVQRRKLAGWAFAPGWPDRHLQVQARLDGTVIGEAIAGETLDFLATSGICPPDHGFVLTLAEALEPGALRRIEVRAIGEGGAWIQLALPTVREPVPGRLIAPRFVSIDRVARPVFVLGANRSATSSIGRALRRAGGFAGFGEGHLLPLLGVLNDALAGGYAAAGRHAEPGQFTMLAATERKVLEDGLAALFLKLVAAHFGERRWMEKTPGAAAMRMAPLYRRLWPGARFVVMLRRGIENVGSAQRKFPDRDFEGLCRDWAETMEAARAVAPALAGAAMGIDQVTLARAPQAVAERLAAFLELDAEAGARLRRALREERAQQTLDPPEDVRSLAEMGWSEAECAVFRRVCGPMMARFGYGEGSSENEAIGNREGLDGAG